MRPVRFGARTAPIAFALITVAAYGLVLPLVGFYWDDWPFAWIATFQGPAEFLPAFRGFRLFLGPIFGLTTSLLPANPLLWQVAGLFVRLFSGLAAWFALNEVWPRARRLTFAAAVLFLVFPGYSQQWVALTHVNQEWIPLIAYLLSIGLSARAIRTPERRTWLRVAAVALLAIGLLPTEYFVGLELLRPAFFWIVIQNEGGKRRGLPRAVLKEWFPYLLVWLANAGWLVYFYKSGLYISYGLDAAARSPTISQIGSVLVDTLWKACLYVWIQVIPLAAIAPGSPSSLGTLAVIVASFLFLAVYLRRLSLEPAGDPRQESSRGEKGIEQSLGSGRSDASWAIGAGLLSVLAGRVPSFAAGLPLVLQSSYDRLMISMMLGSALVIAGGLHWAVRSRAARDLVLAMLAALAMGQQFFNANIFRRDWARQNEIYWQFAWRMPALLPETAILTHQMPLDYETDLAMTAALNWMYADEVKPPDLPYAMIFTEKRLGGEALPRLAPGVAIRLPLRTMEFHGSTSQAVVVYMPVEGCLRVFDPAVGDMETYSVYPDAIVAALPLSDTSRIDVRQPSPKLPTPPFGSEPRRDWCYYYERAELSRQRDDWESILSLRARAEEAQYLPMDPFEWLPFIEAEVRTGDIAWAMTTSRRAIIEDPKIQRGLCGVWQHASAARTAESNGAIETMLTEFGCSQ